MSEQPHVLRLLRLTHEDRVLELLRQNGRLSRADLGRCTGLSRTTLSAITMDLLARQAIVTVQQEEQEKRGRGRPPTLLSLNPVAGHAVGIDLARRYVHVVLMNVTHEVVGSVGRRCGVSLSWERRMRIALELLEQLAEERGIELNALHGIGLGLHGPVVPGAERSYSSSRTIQRLTQFLADRGFTVPVVADNNTRLAALAEALWGRAAGSRNVLYIRMSHAIGGGLVLDGGLFRGTRGGAGEVGHISIDPSGPRCRCGGRGCLELYAGLGAILREARSVNPNVVSLDHLLEAVAAEDEAQRKVLSAAGSRLGVVLAAVCTAVNPEQVVIGGDLARAGEALLGPARQKLRDIALPLARRGLRLDYASLGEEAGARGAIALVLNESALLSRYDLLASQADELPR